MTDAEALSMASESLRFTEQRFRDYTRYPSYEFQRQRIEEAKEARRIVNRLCKEHRSLHSHPSS